MMDIQELLDAIEGKPPSDTEQQKSTDKELSRVKGQPRTVLSGVQAASIGDVIYMGEHNAASVQVICNGAAPVGTITVQGAGAEGGNWDTLPDPQAVQTALTAGKIFDVLCGQAYLRINLSAVTGTYGTGQGFTVIVTPYMAPGQANPALATSSNTIGNVGAAATSVSPAAYTTTNAFADVPGSTLDTLNRMSIAYTIVNSHATNVISWQVLGGNASDFSDAVTVKVSADVAANGGIDSYSATVAVWRYYKVQAMSKVAGTPGTANVHGVSKG